MTTPDPMNPSGAPTPADPSNPAAPPAPAAPPPADPDRASAAPPDATQPGWATPPPAGAAAGATPPPGASPYGTPPPAGSTPPPYRSGSNAPSWSPSGVPDRRDTQPPGLVLGVILVVVGAIFLALRLGNIALGPDAWPLWLIIPGLAMLVGSLFIPSRGGLGLAIPGAILAIVGGIVWVQAAYGLYATWAYAWALVAPGGVGVAMLLYGIVHGDSELVRDGLGTLLTGLGLFVGFGIFFEGVIGISGHRIEHLDQILPYAAIGLGILLIVMAFIDGGRRDAWRDQNRAQRRAAKEQRRAEKAARRAAR